MYTGYEPLILKVCPQETIVTHPPANYQIPDFGKRVIDYGTQNDARATVGRNQEASGQVSKE